MMRKAGVLAGLLAVTAALACADAGDPPSRVARLNFHSGSVSFRPGSVEEWTAATLNYPLTTGDHLWTDADARTEMHIGSSAIRMSPQTALSILNVDDRTVQLSLTEGSLHVRIRDLASDENFEVDTPNVSIVLLRAGEYRIDADADSGVTTVTVRDGEAEVNGGGSAFPVRSTQSARITGVEQVSQELLAASPISNFELWCEERDRREASSVSARYVSREMIGYEDLDDHGTWRDVPEYGWVWAPRTMAAEWAPYRYGRWAWVEPWGWTWIDDAPWGFAPFHYGRWAYAGGGWVWVPGRMVARPVYAPALVAFVGGPRFGGTVAIGSGPVAWFPLGPREVYRPAYRVSDVYVRQLNVTHVNVTNVNVTNVYVNRGVPGAVSAVSRETFVSARPVGGSQVVVSRNEIDRAEIVGGAPLAPRRESVMGRPMGGAAVGVPPARYTERTVVVRHAPPPPPVSFRAQERALESNQGRPLDPDTMKGLRGNQPSRNPMVRIPAPPQPQRPPDMRNDRPIRVQPVEPQRNAEPVQREMDRPRNVEPRRNPDTPRAVEPPQNTAPVQRNVDRPRNVEPQRNTEPVQRNVDRPRNVEPRRNSDTPRAVEPQRNDRPARDAHPDERKAGRSEKRSEKSEKKEEKKDQ